MVENLTSDDPFHPHIMACHHSRVGREVPCVGWLYHQLAWGHNVWVRVWARNCSNIDKLQVVGEQHKRLEDTLPMEGDRDG
jgi:hypothetical protein